MLGGIANDVANDAHAGLGRIDIGVAHHEFFEDVVLNGAAQLRLRYALLFSGHHVTGEHGQHSAVHRHRDRDFVQRNLVEQDLHIFDRVDRHTRFAHVTRHARMVGVVAAMGGQVECDRHTLPACG